MRTRPGRLFKKLPTFGKDFIFRCNSFVAPALGRGFFVGRAKFSAVPGNRCPLPRIYRPKPRQPLRHYYPAP